MSSFLQDIEFASKVNEAIKEAEQRGIDNSLELTKEMIKQQYGDIEQLQQENKQLKIILTELEKYLENNWKSTQDIWYVKIINKIKELKEKYK